MTKKFFFILLFAFMCFFFGCENKIDIDDDGASFPTGEHTLKVVSNCNGLSLSLDEKNLKKGLENINSDLLILPNFYPSAHDEFESKDEVYDPSKWYIAYSNSPSISTMNEETKRYFKSIEELTEPDKKVYLLRYDFILSVSEELGNVELKIDEVNLPKSNILSIIFMGPDGFQEMESDGDYVTEGILAKNLNSSESINFSLIIYMNGNDENCTTNKITDYLHSSGEFCIKLNAKK